jgi:hypothetical protein
MLKCPTSRSRWHKHCGFEASEQSFEICIWDVRNDWSANEHMNDERIQLIKVDKFVAA